MSQPRAPTYDLLKDFGDDPESVSVSPHWVVAVVRLGLPLSFSRKEGKSVTTDVSQGARLRGPTLLLASDCFSLTVTGDKDSHTKSMVAELKQTDHNYLVEILPGDWVLAWIVHDETKFLDLLARIKKADPQDPCNKFDDGLKFVGRADSIRKRITLDKGAGVKTTSVTLSAIGFRELDTQFYYNQYLSENDQSAGTWLTKVGVDVGAVFAASLKDGQKNNSRALISTLLDLLVGKGVKGQKVNQAQVTVRTLGHENLGSLQQTAGGGTLGDGTEAPFAYLVPRQVAALLGITQEGVSKHGGITSYADILATLMGVQKYSDNGDADNEQATFVPRLDEGKSTDNRMLTPTDLLGTFIPVMPPFTNKPLWSVFQQFLNPAVNEMYTCLRPNRAGRIMPTMVLRQIPFTTDAFDFAMANQPPKPPYRDTRIEVTRFLELPRWKMPSVIVESVDVGRSDATRINFVQVYGQDVNQAEGVTFPQQTAVNPPVRDDLDIQRSGLRSYITTVACAIRDTVGKTPSTWIALVADRTIGSQYTLNGSLTSVGVQAPVAEGDNLEWEDTVYHIESLTHHALIDATGHKTFTTSFTLTNGMRSDGISDTDGNDLPIYPGFRPEDNRLYDPGVSVDDKYDRTEPSLAQGDLADPNATPTNAPDNSADMQPSERSSNSDSPSRGVSVKE